MEAVFFPAWSMKSGSGANVFLTDLQIEQSLADLLKLAGGVGALPANAPNVVTEAHAAAYNEVVGRLLARGYTLAQITAWDQGVFYERQITLFFCMVNLAGTFGYDEKWIAMYDRRKDLATVMLSIGGTFVSPQSVDGSGTVGGGVENTANDIFVWPPAGDRTLGGPWPGGRDANPGG